VDRPNVARAALIAGAVAVMAVLAGCSGGGGAASSTSSSASSPLGSGASTTPARTTPVKTTPARTTPAATHTIAVPKVISSAQPAVDAYIAYLRAAVPVEADPAQIRRGDMNQLLGSKAKKAINATLDALGKAGIGYRGTPPDPHVKVVEVKTSRLVFLTSCPVPAKTDPYRQVVLDTGRAVKVSDRRPGPPYQRSLTMFHNKKRWVLINFSDDTSRTCTG
jgi:hypothetical protein